MQSRVLVVYARSSIVVLERHISSREETHALKHTRILCTSDPRVTPPSVSSLLALLANANMHKISQNTLSIQNGWVGADKKQPHSLFMETTKDVLQPHGARPVLRMQDTKPRLAAAMSRHQVSRKVLAMDLTGSASFPLPERTSYLGALLTVVAVGLWLTYIVALTLAWAKNPPRSTSDIRWSSNHGPSEGSAGPPVLPHRACVQRGRGLRHCSPLFGPDAAFRQVRCLCGQPGLCDRCTWREAQNRTMLFRPA